jgi:hypothetical protein
MNSKTSQSPSSAETPIYLRIRGIGHIPSKKNAHYPLTNGGLGIDKSVRERMKYLEYAIESALYSLCQTTESGMRSECLKQLRTRLSGLLDDSIREIPSGAWATVKVPKGEEGLDIIIDVL